MMQDAPGNQDPRRPAARRLTFALAKAAKIVRGLRLGLTREEREAIADAAVKRIADKPYDPWKLKEQAASYNLMKQAAGVTQQADIASATGEEQAAAEYSQEAQLISESGTASEITGGIQALAGIAEAGAAFALLA
jgi:hypothetical protein